MPQLILAGHTAPDTEKWATLVPAYQQASSEAVSAFASALTTCWARRAGQESPQLRAYRARAVDAGRAWINHRHENA